MRRKAGVTVSRSSCSTCSKRSERGYTVPERAYISSTSSIQVLQPSSKQSCLSAEPPLRQRFSLADRISHTSAEQTTHKDACRRLLTGCQAPRVCPWLLAASSHPVTAVVNCWSV